MPNQVQNDEITIFRHSVLDTESSFVSFGLEKRADSYQYQKIDVNTQIIITMIGLSIDDIDDV